MVILVDLGDDTYDIVVSNAYWSATVAVLRSLSLLGEERLQRLETVWLGQQLTQEEARVVGEAVVAGPLATIKWSHNVYPPDSLWVKPGKHSRDYEQSTYWPSWLRAFAGFCLTCRGFVVY